jgi:hypothetical protein
MKNLDHREGFLNRHVDGLPDQACVIKIVTQDFLGEEINFANWRPYKEGSYKGAVKPAPGYLGTANWIGGPYDGIGFHAWEQSDSEFVWYKIVGNS